MPGRWRTGFVLTPRGEFSIVIAGLAVGAGVEPQLAPLATAYVLITVVAGSVLARVPDTSWFRKLARYPRAVPAVQVSQPLRPVLSGPLERARDASPDKGDSEFPSSR